MKELVKRKDSIDHLKHFGKKDSNLFIHDSYIESGHTERAKKFLEYRKLWESVSEGSKTPDFPYFVTFSFSDSCNLSCAHCYRTFNKDKTERHLLEYDEAVRLIDECKKIGVYSIGIGSESEVFVYKRIADVMKRISENRFEDTWVYTNGTLLNDERIDLILDSDVTRLSISVDAVTGETYRKTRGGDFNKLMSNIFNFLDKREKRKTKLPVLRVTAVKYNLTEPEIGLFVDFWSKIADEVDVQPLIDIKNIDELRYDKIEKINCIYPKRMLYITWNGDYKPCCSEFCKHLTIGNIRNMSIPDAWNSEYMRDLRLQLCGKKPLNKACLNCLRSLHSTEKYEPLTLKEK